MFGRKREQETQEAMRRAEAAERVAREARAEADAMQEKEKKGFLGLFKRKHEEATSEGAPAEQTPDGTPAPALPAEPVRAAEPPKESRRTRKKREREEKRAEERIRELELQLQRSEKKRRSARFCDFFAFIVLLLAALLMLLGPLLKMILSQTGDEGALKTVSIVAQYCLLAAIAIPAWYFVYRKNIAWKLIYFFALAGFIAGNILGLTL